MAQDVAKVILPGPCKVLVNAVDRGYTDQEGAEVTIESTYVDAFAGKFGAAAPVAKFRNGEKATVKFVLIQTVMTDLDDLFSMFTAVTSGGNTKLTIGSTAGAPMVGVSIKLQPEQAARTPGSDFLLTNAVPVGKPMPVYTGGKFQSWEVEFEGLIDTVAGSDGSWLGTLGDAAISADVTPPTITTSTPADGASGVATSVVPVIQFSEAMNQGTLDGAHVKLIEWSGAIGTSTATVKTVTITSTPTSLVITPAAALTTLKIYSIQMNDLTDVAGNKLNGGWASIDFTIA